jgi:polyisoprenoid-binding protein YceI
MSTATEQALPTGTWAIDPVHSTVGFEVQYNAGTFRGTFDKADAKLADGALSGSADVASVNVKDENLAGHLQAPDFFDAERYPRISFETKEVVRDGDNLEVKGELTLKGHTEPVAITGTVTGPLTDAMGNERVGFKLSTTVDRTVFGLNWNLDLPSGGKALADEVTITAELQLVRAEA